MWQKCVFKPRSYSNSQIQIHRRQRANINRSFIVHWAFIFCLQWQVTCVMNNPDSKEILLFFLCLSLSHMHTHTNTHLKNPFIIWFGNVTSYRKTCQMHLMGVFLKGGWRSHPLAEIQIYFRASVGEDRTTWEQPRVKPTLQVWVRNFLMCRNHLKKLLLDQSFFPSVLFFFSLS